MKAKKLINYLLILTFLAGSLFFVQPAKAAAGDYRLEINTYTNTVTAYKKQSDSSYSPVRVMLCSTGLPHTPTPKGTFNTLAKYRWKELMGGVYGQYSTRIVGGVLFHSVLYRRKDPKSLIPGPFEKLGSSASHGCVRLAVEDAKWIYDNCDVGTTVKIYADKNPGPLGKPKPVPYTKYTGYDPTDVWSGAKPLERPQENSQNPSPVLTVPKKITLSSKDYSYDLLKGVKAVSYDGKNITADVEIEENIDFGIAGSYTIKYSVTDKNGNTASASTTAIVK